MDFFRVSSIMIKDIRLHGARIDIVNKSEGVSGQSKKTALVIYLAFLAKVVNLYYMILTPFKQYWPDTVAKFTSGTQETFI